MTENEEINIEALFISCNFTLIGKCFLISINKR